MTRRYLISGVVQGVGYRYFVVRRAAALGLRGWVRNLPDGRVEVVATGDDGHLATFETDLQAGPPHARVSQVENSEISDELVMGKSFDIRQ